MSNPLVSVIIPSYDRSVFLRTRSIPSVLNQTYTNWELIVVGDGPRDNKLREAVESFNDSRIRYVEIPRPDYSKLTREQFWHVAGAAARNFALSLARGEIIAPLDDDDEFLPNHLQDCVEPLAEGRADLVYGCTLVHNLETGNEYEDLFSWEDLSNRALFLQRNILFHSSVCYSSRFAHLEYPLEGEVAADYGLWLAILKAGGRFISLNAPQFRYYGDNLTSILRVSIPSLPPMETFQQCVQDIFKSRVLSNGGKWCAQFEEAISTYLDVPYAITAGSGDTALIMAFQVLQNVDLKRREVILPSYTFPSTMNALLWNRYTPVFCDIDPRSLCITPEIVEPLISADTAAIVAVHAHGNPCDMEGLEALAAKHKIRLIADAAPALGARIGERRVGSFGDMEVFSLSGTKILTSGEGGVICCRDETIAQLLRRIGRYGLNSDYTCMHLGVNGKFAEIPAALATIQLPMLNSLRDKREQVAREYQRLLEAVPELRFQTVSSLHAVSAWKDFALILPSSEQALKLSTRLRAYRIDSRPYYRPLHSMPAFSQYKRGVLDVTERLSNCVLCVPFYADIRKEVISLIAEVIQEVFSK